MTKDIRVIGFDLDDTALDSRKQLRPQVRQALEAAAAAGITVLPATGRMLAGIPQPVLDVKGVRYALTANGAKVYDLEADKVLFSDCFDKETALDVLRELTQYHCFPGVYMDGMGYTDSGDFGMLGNSVTPEIREYLQKTRVQVEDLASLIQHSDALVEKFANHFPDKAEWQRAWDAISARDDVSVTTSMPQNIEINTASCNKGAALVHLAGALGYTRAQVMAVGDSLNDLEMLRHVGYAVAMGNALPEVKAAADAVTGSAEESGLAEAVYRILG